MRHVSELVTMDDNIVSVVGIVGIPELAQNLYNKTAKAGL